MALTIKQAQVAALLGGGHAQAAAAREVGVNPATIWRWLRLPEFRAAVKDAEDKTINKRLREAIMPALDLLMRQMMEGEGYVAQNAARELLTRAGITGAQDKQASQVQIVFGDIEIGEGGKSDG